MRALGRLDILVANAGVWNLEDLPIEKMAEKQWDDMIRINLKSVYSIIHFTVPHMIKQKSARSSDRLHRGPARRIVPHPYGASKGGIISFTKGLLRTRPHISSSTPCPPAGSPPTCPFRCSNEGRPEDGFHGYSARPRRYRRRNRRAYSLCGFRPGQLHDGEVINVNGGSVLCG